MQRCGWQLSRAFGCLCGREAFASQQTLYHQVTVLQVGLERVYVRVGRYDHFSSQLLLDKLAPIGIIEVNHDDLARLERDGTLGHRHHAVTVDVKLFGVVEVIDELHSYIVEGKVGAHAYRRLEFGYELGREKRDRVQNGRFAARLEYLFGGSLEHVACIGVVGVHLGLGDFREVDFFGRFLLVHTLKYI